MTEKWKDEAWAQDIWYSGKVTRRTLVGWGGGAIGAAMLVPAPWRAAFGAATPYKIGSLQPLSGAAALGGKTAVVGLQMAIDRINKSGGVNGRPLEAIIADDESKPDVGRRKTEKLLVEDKVDVHVGGFLSNICLACMPVFEENKVVNMISVCLDTTLTTTKCNRYSFRTYDFAPAQAVAIAPYLVNKMGKKWHIAFADYSWGQSTRDAYAAEIKKLGGEVVGTTGIPLGTADMTPFLSKIRATSTGCSASSSARTASPSATRPTISASPRSTSGRATAPSPNRSTCRRSATRSRASSASTATFRCSRAPLDTPAHHKFFDEAKARLAKIDPSGPLPDRYVQSNYEAINALKLGMEKSKFEGRQDTMKLIEALEGLVMKEGDDFPQGGGVIRKEDHQAFIRQFIFEIKGGKHQIDRDGCGRQDDRPAGLQVRLGVSERATA